MMISLPDMEPSDMIGYLITAIICLGGVVAWLHRDTIKRMDKDKRDLKTDFDSHKADTKETIKTLDGRLFETLQKKQEAELRALKFEFIAKSPCALAECPRRTSFSISEGAAPPVV